MSHFPEKIIPILDKIVLVALFLFTAFSLFSISITQVVGGIGGMAWLLRSHISGSWHEQRWPLGVPFLLFILACLVAVIDAYDISYSYKSLKKIFEILIFFWVVNCARENRLRDSLSILLISAATLASLHGLYQGWRDGVTIMTRVEGAMSVYMTFAGLLMLVGTTALARALFKRPREAWLWLAIVTILACLLITFTRQAWFGFLLGFFFLVFAWKRKLALTLAGMILVSLLIYGSQIQSQVSSMTTQKDPPFTERTTGVVNVLNHRISRLISGQDENLLIRIALWKGAWEIFKDHPLTGCGFRCVDLVNSQYPDPTGHIKKYRGMHNNFVQLAVDTGILGLSAWLGIWVVFFRLLYARTKDFKVDPSEKWVVFGSSAAGIAFLAGGCFESNFYDSEVVMALYLIMALPFAGSRPEELAS
jgi:O-antigen ligase